jgi:hypothetical protein
MEQDPFLKEDYILKIDKEGTWFYNDLPIINKNIYRFFNQHIEKDKDGGYFLRIGKETCQLVVEDTPYVVVSVDHLSLGTGKKEIFKIRLNDESEEALDLSTFYIGKNNVPYCRVKNGEFPARFLRSPYYCLAQHIHQEGAARFYLILNKEKFYIQIFS